MTPSTDTAGRVAVLRRYPVKSMLGEQCTALELSPLGVAGDRRYAFIDDETGRVATAKNPRLWRRLLQCSATTGPEGVVIALPDGRAVPVGAADAPVSHLVGRSVHVADERAAGAVVERSDLVDVLTHGIDAEIYWPGVGRVRATELVLRRLLPLAHEGLAAWGVGSDEAHRYLDLIEQRCLTGTNGADWFARQMQQRHDEDRYDALRAVLGEYRTRMHDNQPVHTW